MRAHWPHVTEHPAPGKPLTASGHLRSIHRVHSLTYPRTAHSSTVLHVIKTPEQHDPPRHVGVGALIASSCSPHTVERDCRHVVRQTKAACSCGLKRLAALSSSVAGWNKGNPSLSRLSAFSQRHNGFSNPAVCSGLSHSLNNERLVRIVRETQDVARLSHGPTAVYERTLL